MVTNREISSWPVTKVIMSAANRRVKTAGREDLAQTTATSAAAASGTGTHLQHQLEFVSPRGSRNIFPTLNRDKFQPIRLHGKCALSCTVLSYRPQ